ncbi:uncharacterized protein DUF3649 [Paraburkholderia unamae]|uniref:DUF3649 domain-containing protein n=1 Tax=Paraburkholderia unamae TaxID=219649 RepID=UPI000DC4FD93|nr:DUF3649 domain-containing protein [Paraburkholderia unamae]RAR58336.1 uncharacterized protein DUF3649 [Paraburkholderia unamae]
MSAALPPPRGVRRAGPLVARIVGAVFGGYALGALASVAALALPMSAPQAVITGMLASFVFYAGAVIWMFLARSARRAWAGLLLVALPLALAAWWASSATPVHLIAGATTSDAPKAAATGGTVK